MMDDGGDDGDGGVDDYGVDMEGFEGPDGAGNLEYGDMVEAARKVDKIDVQYAKKAKKVSAPLPCLAPTPDDRFLVVVCPSCLFR